jgi:hypothetical protein
LRKAIWRNYGVGMEPVVVFRTFDLAEAQLLRSRLAAAGLDAELAQENSAANFDVPGGGVRIVVPPEQVEDARELIESGEDEQ